MADFTALKTAIQTYIKQNGNEEITGDILQEILLSVVTTLGDGAINDLITALGNEVTARQQADGTLQQNITNEATVRGNADTALGGRIDDEATARGNADTALSNRLGSTITAENTAADQIAAEAEAREAADTALGELIDGITDNIENGYVYAGIATPSSIPTTGKVFYLALTAGTYTNFGSTVVSQGINILKYNGSAWSLDAFIGIDDTPTPNSPKLVKSGGVFDNIMTDGSAFDISAHFASGGTLATYADLDAALTALDTLSVSYKRGGMSIKFAQSSDNKYVQYFLPKDEWSANADDWQKTNLEEEVIQLGKDVKDTGNWIPETEHSGEYIQGSVWQIGSGRTYKIISVPNASGILHVVGGSDGDAYITFLSEYLPVDGSSEGILQSTTTIHVDQTKDINVPSGTNYIYVLWKSGTNRAPAELYLNDIDLYAPVKNAVLSDNQRIESLQSLIEPLTDSVDELNYVTLSKINWIRGAVSNTTGVINPNLKYRVVTERIFRAEFPTQVDCISTDYKFIIATYTESGEWIGYDGSWKRSKLIPEGTYFRIMVQGFPEDTSVTLDIDAASAAIKIDNLISLIESVINQENAGNILSLNPLKTDILPRLAALKKAYRTYGDAPSGSVLSLAYFSDLHGNNDNLLRIKEVIDAITIDDAIQTGDYVGNQFTDAIPSGNWNTLLSVIGNHDASIREGTSPNYTWVLQPQLDVYNKMIAPFVANWDVVQPVDSATYGYCYYYKDYTASNVRLIVLDCMNWDATQLTWFTGVLDSARQSGIHVLCAVHYPPFVIEQIRTANPFTSMNFGAEDVRRVNTQAAEAVGTFITNGGKFVAWLCGHIHQDVSGFGRVSDGFDNQFAFSIAAAGVAPRGNYSEMPATVGDKTQDCFNIIGVDTVAMTFKVMRIGADYDIYMRRRNTLCINYDTATIVYADM